MQGWPRLRILVHLSHFCRSESLQPLYYPFHEHFRGRSPCRDTDTLTFPGVRMNMKRALETLLHSP